MIEYKPQILVWIEKMFQHAEEKKWYETYWFIDLHGVISIPDYRKNSKEIIYYPYVKQTLQFITNSRPDIIMILFTSSYPDEIESYINQFNNDGILFKYVNENPEVSDAKGSFGFYDKKPYYNVLIDDKCGFDPFLDWKPIYEYFINSEYKPDPNWSTKTIEKYHTSDEEIKPIYSDFIIENGNGIMGADGMYYHFSEVIKMLKLFKK
jgi:hypothetical protein